MSTKLPTFNMYKKGHLNTILSFVAMRAGVCEEELLNELNTSLSDSCKHANLQDLVQLKT